MPIMCYLLVVIVLVLLLPSSEQAECQLSFYTADVFLAGTSAEVYVTLYGEYKQSVVAHVPASGGFTRDGKNEVRVRCTELGVITRINVRHDNSGAVPGWKLDKIIIDDSVSNGQYECRCNEWVSSASSGTDVTCRVNRQPIRTTTRTTSTTRRTTRTTKTTTTTTTTTPTTTSNSTTTSTPRAISQQAAGDRPARAVFLVPTNETNHGTTVIFSSASAGVAVVLCLLCFVVITVRRKRTQQTIAKPQPPVTESPSDTGSSLSESVDRYVNVPRWPPGHVTTARDECCYMQLDGAAVRDDSEHLYVVVKKSTGVKRERLAHRRSANAIASRK